jgi:hypothetical protein
MLAIDLHLDFPPSKIVKTDKIVDESGGMYPCYYIQKDSEVWVSTSVVSLIQELGSLSRNPDFEIPSSIKTLGEEDGKTLAEAAVSRLPSGITSKVPPQVVSGLRELGVLSSQPHLWSPDWHTLDDRITRIRPFETVTADSATQDFTPTYSLDDPVEYAKKTAEHMECFVQKIEDRYPNRDHIILTGGKDSLLISLVEKKTDNWHIFSSEPNYPLVESFVERNSLDVKNVIRDDGVNRESTEDLQEKLLACDLFGNPRHTLWMTSLRSLINELGSDVIIWNGSGGGEILQHRPNLEYPYTHITRVPLMQGLYHQNAINFLGQPALSPYYTPEMWENVFKHFNPGMMDRGLDVRPRIGEILHGDEVRWPQENPSPDPYIYDLDTDPVEFCRVLSI